MDNGAPMERLIGVLSDTHGLLRPEVKEKLRGCELIVHAGDVGNQSVLDELQKIGTIVAVRGNVDRGPWADALREWELIEFHGRTILLIHNIAHLEWEPKSAKVDAVVYGHSHRASSQYTKGVLYLNPGSAGPKRFTLPITMAYIRVTDGEMKPEIITVED